MAKNLIPDIAKMLGVELNEEFKIKGAADWMLFHFEEHGLRVRNVDEKVELSDGVDSALFERLLGGYLEIIKLPWKPKMYEEYWTFGKLGKKWIVGTLSWKKLPYEILLFDKGWVYRSEKEAQAALPSVAKELGVEYKL